MGLPQIKYEKSIQHSHEGKMNCTRERSINGYRGNPLHNPWTDPDLRQIPLSTNGLRKMSELTNFLQKLTNQLCYVPEGKDIKEILLGGYIRNPHRQ